MKCFQGKAVLDTNKREAARVGIPNITPKTKVTDFELAIKNAALAAYEGVTIRYCFFHLKQSLYRRVQDEGLKTAYNDPDDRTLKEFFHSLLSLGFVPLDYVEAAYDALYDEILEEGLPVAVYFEENYSVGRRAHGRRRAVPPRFLAKYWNCYP